MLKVLIPNGQLPPSYALACQLLNDNYKVYFTVDEQHEEFVETNKIYSFKGIKQPKTSWLLSKHTERTQAEDNDYINSIIRICQENEIKILFPSNDIDIYVFSKAKVKFINNGISLCCTEYSILLNFLDKYISPKLAGSHNINAPKTILYSDGLTWDEAREKLGDPIIVKARYSHSSTYVWKAKSEEEYSLYVKRLRYLDRTVVLQSYIEGTEEYSYHYLIDNNNEVAFGFKNYKPRHFKASWSTACEILEKDALYKIGAEFLKGTAGPGFWVLQTKKCSIDDKHYFIEVNSRFGNNSRILFNMIKGNLVTSTLDIFLGKEQRETLNVRKKRGGALIEELLQIFFSKNTAKLNEVNVKGTLEQIYELLRFYIHLPAMDIYACSLSQDAKYVIDYYRKLLKVMKS
ncbi:hypothetical protein ACJJJB_21160 [Microbulbifer sp. ANSA001]|uniref:hypothetical protein n=1 Tax=Microbulbifer sp. ANSA001 TaxID=3243358 RepID=UPI004041202D